MMPVFNEKEDFHRNMLVYAGLNNISKNGVHYILVFCFAAFFLILFWLDLQSTYLDLFGHFHDIKLVYY